MRLARFLVPVLLLSVPACTTRQSKSETTKENRVSDSSQSAPPAAPAPAGASACSATLKADGGRLVATVRNDGPAPVYLLQSDRMPYVIVEGADQVVLAWSIQPVPTDRDLGAIATLATVAVAPGTELQRDAALRAPLQVSDHFSGPHAHAGALPATVKVVAEFGVIDEALDPAQRHRQNYPSLVSRQRTCRSAPVTVTL
jgi:hypothetical protein